MANGYDAHAPALSVSLAVGNYVLDCLLSRLPGFSLLNTSTPVLFVIGLLVA